MAVASESRIDRETLREHLVRTRIAGEVATSREANLANFRLMVARDPGYQFGLRLRDWTFEETLAMMARLCGVSPDPAHAHGVDTIDPDRTIDALDAMAERLAYAARHRATVLFATGHPATLMGVYRAVADKLGARGCPIPTPADNWSYASSTDGLKYREISYTSGVAALVSKDGEYRHTHDPQPMQAMLSDLQGTGTWPDLVMADHGWAGAAAEAGIDTVGFADCNDPALFAGLAEGKLSATVPLDDGILPTHYRPLITYLLDRADLAD
ncbi:phosphatase [Nocardia sp. NPDC050712]|uniref:phosphatase n=1 Tax=Nocardia sp. NPDC050712 TaxID=3155518 RepID=UPI00340AAE9D